MVDVNVVIGEPVETNEGHVIIPVTRVAFGFAAGGGEYTLQAPADAEQMMRTAATGDFPFGGGSGAGVSVAPMGFLVVGQGQVRMLPVEGTQPVDRLIDMVPNLIEKLRKPKPEPVVAPDMVVGRVVPPCED